MAKIELYLCDTNKFSLAALKISLHIKMIP